MEGEGAVSFEEATCLVRRALLALATGDVGAIDIFTEDVIGDSPNLRVRSRSELQYQLLDRFGALSNVDFHLDRVETDGPATVVASWRVAGDHTGEVLFNEDVYFAPSGRRIRLSVTTRVVFRQGRIAAFETFYDDQNLFDQIRGRPSHPDQTELT
jgi:ketosteroid isomerase-like protein